MGESYVESRPLCDVLLGRMAAAGRFPDRTMASNAALGIFYDGHCTPVLSSEGLFRAYDGAYGDRYWTEWMSRNFNAGGIARLLAIHLAFEAIDDRLSAQLGITWRPEQPANAPALRRAYFFTRVPEIAAALTSCPSTGAQTFDSAVRWLAGHPLFQHFLPLSLAAWIDAGRPVRKAQSTQPLREATNEEIVLAIRAEYEVSDPAPNLIETWKLVQERLSSAGLRASKLRVQDLAGLPEFKHRRRESGKHRSRS